MVETTHPKRGRKKQGRHPERVLPAAFVRTVKQPGRYFDGLGLSLLVTPTGGRCWIQRLTIAGRVRELGLGGYPVVTLAQAREAALANKRLARQGGDPLAEKRKRAVPTFAEAAAQVLALHRPGWRNDKHAAQWEATLRQYAFPLLGDRLVHTITAADILAVLAPIWHVKAETARRVRQRIGAVMKWAIAQGFRADNPAGDTLSQALGRQADVTQHMRALPHREVAGAIHAVQDSQAGLSTKLAFAFLVLTAARSGEVRLATWEEVDLEAKVWAVPAERMKAQRAHRVPLSDRVVQVLTEAQALADGSGLVFPSPTGKPLSNMTLSKLLKDLDIPAVPHGFRSSFRDWAQECTNAPRAVMEAALAHANPDKVEAAYARSDLFERRRTLMDQWAGYLTEVSDKVVPLVRRRR